MCRLWRRRPRRLFSRGFTRMPRARDGRTQGCVFVARTLSTRVRAVRVLDNMCVLAWCIDPEHFVLDSSAHFKAAASGGSDLFLFAAKHQGSSVIQVNAQRI